MADTKSNPSVLIAEDDPMIADLYEVWLGDDYDVEIVERGETVLDTLSGRSFDAIILDRGLPDMSGSDVLATIRDLGIETPVGMVTGKDSGVESIDADFDDYLSKPVSRESVLEMVERFLTVRSVESLERELSELRVKRNILDVERSEGLVENDDQFHTILDRISELESQMEGLRDILERESPSRAAV